MVEKEQLTPKKAGKKGKTGKKNEIKTGYLKKQ